MRSLLGDNKADFLIPDYQRPYAWEEKECQTLWDDIFSFAFPDNDCDKFDRHKGYTNLRKQWKAGTQIQELLNMADTMTDFQEKDIVQRNASIIFAFTEYLKENGLVSEEA